MGGGEDGYLVHQVTRGPGVVKPPMAPPLRLPPSSMLGCVCSEEACERLRGWPWQRAAARSAHERRLGQVAGHPFCGVNAFGTAPSPFISILRETAVRSFPRTSLSGGDDRKHTARNGRKDGLSRHFCPLLLRCLGRTGHRPPCHQLNAALRAVLLLRGLRVKAAAPPVSSRLIRKQAPPGPGGPAGCVRPTGPCSTPGQGTRPGHGLSSQQGRGAGGQLMSCSHIAVSLSPSTFLSLNTN